MSDSLLITHEELRLLLQVGKNSVHQKQSHAWLKTKMISHVSECELQAQDDKNQRGGITTGGHNDLFLFFTAATSG